MVKQQGGKSGLGDWQMLLQERLCAILHHPLQRLPHEQEEQHCLLILLSGPGTPCCSLAPSTALGEHGADAIGGQGPRPRHHQVSLGGAPIMLEFGVLQTILSRHMLTGRHPLAEAAGSPVPWWWCCGQIESHSSWSPCVSEYYVYGNKSHIMLNII